MVASGGGVNAASEPGPARFWQPLETAVEAVGSAPLDRLPSILADLVVLLVGDLIPRLRAEEIVLLPLVTADQRLGETLTFNHAEVSRAAEAISTLSLRPISDLGRVHQTASRLLRVLREQRRAEATLVTLIRALPVADRSAAILGDRLEEAAQASRDSEIFVSEADRLPTEAWVLRHNPKPPRIGRLALGRRSPVADLVGLLEVNVDL